ncbi:unnamed protein product [Gongylonema pulchrum]|uniref:Diphosphomevalonate decarboxylase n=1 Tax=Gongylonema pulchrum TaxID=637853 RepID=A0A183EWT6_9BILA|nr:unnamed protein product [Gongylonema pulchrum]
MSVTDDGDLVGPAAATASDYEVKLIAPINIALVKYWGKRDEELMLPLNDSISLSINDVCAETRIRVGPSVSVDSVSINGSTINLAKHPRFSRCFKVELEVFIFLGSEKIDSETVNGSR